MDKLNKKKAADISHVSPQILELLLDVILDVMQAEHGSIMLLDNKNNELSIKTARGLKKEIIHNASVCLGRGIAGKVAVSGQAVFLKGADDKRQPEIELDDFTNPEIDTAYVTPIKFVDGTTGVINIKSLHPNHGIKPEKERLVQEILSRFSEYLLQVELPPNSHESPSQLYMMNIFQEYNTIRELREVFDYIFQLTAEIIKIPQKGFFLLKNQESNFFDLVLGYGFELNNYREIYENLIPRFKEIKLQSTSNITIFNRKDFSLSSNTFFNEELLLLMPLKLQDNVKGFIVFLVDEEPVPDEVTSDLIQTICETAAKTIEVSISGQKYRERAFVDNLTGTYNYGLWWKRIEEEFSRAQRLKDTKLSLIILDIDKFNRLNLAHGYFVGDQLLRVIADRIKSCIRPTDIIGRIGGEEFGILLLGTEKRLSLNVINRIIDSISEIPAEIRIKLSYPITLSCGISEYPKDAKDSGELVEKAKMALVSAKIMGGNRIKFFGPLEE